MIEEMSVSELKEALANDAYCKKLGYALQSTYPSRRWYVEVLSHGNLAVVKVPEISMDYGNIVKLEQSIEVDIKRIVMAGGELLERFGLTRGRSDNSDLMGLARNHKGVIGAKAGEVTHAR